MRWSWKILEIRGIPIRVHATFGLLVAWILLAYWARDHSVLAALSGTGFLLAIFAIVLLHELSHALAAQRYGIRTRDIILLPIGGVSRLERMPEKPSQELVVALAGPATNIVIAGGIFLGLRAVAAPIIPDMTVASGGFLQRFAWANVVLAVFNLLPAFPMDGGRVLRALLATFFDYTDATHIAASLGQLMALVFGFLGLLTNPLLVFIALFIWLGAAEESALVQMRSAVSGIPVGKAMIAEFQALDPGNTLGDAADHFVKGFQHDFPVIRDGELLGLLTRADLLSGLARLGREAKVADAMRTRFETAEEGEMLEYALLRMREHQSPALPVLRNGRVVGIFMPENVSELLDVEAALKQRAQLREQAPPASQAPPPASQARAA